MTSGDSTARFVGPWRGRAARSRLGGRRTRPTAAFVAACLLVVMGASPSSAVYYSGGMDTNHFCVQNPNVNSTWLDAINKGRLAWNQRSNFDGNITVYNACTHFLLVGTYGGTWLGLYSPLMPGWQYRIRLDSKNLNSHISANGYSFGKVVRSTTAHEFGHALSLDHPASQPSHLMSSSRNRNLVTQPKAAEVDESNSYY